MPMVRCNDCKNQYWVETLAGEPCFICKYKKEQKKKQLSRVAQERRDRRQNRRR